MHSLFKCLRSESLGREGLRHAARWGFPRSARHFLARGVGANAEIDDGPYGPTAFHVAVAYKQFEVVDILLEALLKGPDAEAALPGWLCHAIFSQEMGLVARILGTGYVDTNACRLDLSERCPDSWVGKFPPDGYRPQYVLPLNCAIAARSTQAVRLLLEAGANVRGHDSINESGNHRLHEEGQARRSSPVPAKRRREGLSDQLPADVLLNLAVANRTPRQFDDLDIEILRLLCPRTPQPGQNQFLAPYSLRDGQTPLHFVAQCGARNARKVIQVLVSLGSNVDALDRFGRTPLLVACLNAASKNASDLPSIVSTVESLLILGANPNIADNEESTPLRVACKANSTNLVLTLVNSTALTEITDTQLDSLVPLARRDYTIAALLTGPGVQPSTALRLVSRFNQWPALERVIESFASQGQDLWAQPDNEDSLLHAILKHPSSWEREWFPWADIIERIPNVKAKDSQGHTLLEYAAQNGYTSCVSNLLDKGATFSILETWSYWSSLRQWRVSRHGRRSRNGAGAGKQRGIRKDILVRLFQHEQQVLGQEATGADSPTFKTYLTSGLKPFELLPDQFTPPPRKPTQNVPMSSPSSSTGNNRLKEASPRVSQAPGRRGPRNRWNSCGGDWDEPYVSRVVARARPSSSRLPGGYYGGGQYGGTSGGWSGGGGYAGDGGGSGGPGGDGGGSGGCGGCGSDGGCGGDGAGGDGGGG
ncbi:hypothetical protein SAPIO_CDS6370 [Scedosporium apiospermum]|uniref:Uncharacterized protein n=1 Tax=Pseudallescheria apiosperma TaxID=563466 RepID=A0A084G465_PSEDA|nr:uncharacterized protein SAPIO_CDS6370 [Scedosporium apiospermum]KEZ42127.1 hypothetical protein SAPIO_CDS6370 [Scedosporium apiospermum]